jgi:hypothetical protein
MSDGTNKINILIEFAQEKWEEQDLMQSMINLDHPEPEVECWRMHEIEKVRYEQIIEHLKLSITGDKK